MSSDSVKEKLHNLHVSYTKNLPNKIAGIENLWLNLQKNWDQKRFQDFHREVHSLCGSAGTYGYSELSKSARQFEIYLKSLLDSPSISLQQQEIIFTLLNDIKTTFKQSVPETFPEESAKPVKNNINKIIYILNQGDEFISDLNQKVKDSGYSLYKTIDINELKHAIENKRPIAIMVDVQLVDDKSILILNALQKELPIPLFCTSSKGDILTRLKAIRIGSLEFFQNPIDPFYLTKKLDQYCLLLAEEPYRILIIDDSRSVAEYFALILQDAGMIANFITNPLLLIEAMEELQPDLILMDIYMPECTGLELATAIRQEAQYTKIPIIFLSTEEDRGKQLSALNLGGDDFLTKPILPQYLVEAVKSRAKRAGILSSFMMRDSLTGLLNHTNILQRLDVELARAKRQGETLIFIMLDIDNFKKINDTYGHPVGDKVLRSLSNLLDSSLRKTDAVGRYGGEEFAVILPNTTNDKAIKLCNYLREKFAHISYKVNNTEFYVTFSAGLSSFPQLRDAKAIITRADKALYTAKHNGRNQVVYLEEEFPADLII